MGKISCIWDGPSALNHSHYDNIKETHGGLKYCSSTTYIPLINSVMRKKFPALSKVLSFPSSHLSGFGILKPFAGGPLGVALTTEEVENVAPAGRRATIDGLAESVKVEGRTLRARSIVPGRADAIASEDVLGERRGARGVVVMRSLIATYRRVVSGLSEALVGWIAEEN
jgi:hypothetical protein